MSRPILGVDPLRKGDPAYRPSRAIEHKSIVPAGRPTCPRYLSKIAKQRFRQLCRELEARRALTRGDGELLTLYCTTYDRWRRAMDDVATRGEVVVSVSRGIERERKNPWLLIAQESEKSMVGILDRLGLSPLNREKVRKTKTNEAEEPLPDNSVGAILARMEEEDGTSGTSILN